MNENWIYKVRYKVELDDKIITEELKKTDINEKGYMSIDLYLGDEIITKEDYNKK